jgi:predicted Zn finger-like uncharacterized protein
MAIETSCPNCGKEYSLADAQLGKTVRCKGCEDTFVVEPPRRARRGRDEDDEDRRDSRPRSGRWRDDDEDDDAPRRSRRRRDDDEDDDAPRRSRRRRDDDEDDDAPRGSRQRAGAGSYLPLILGIGGGVALLAVVLVAVVLLMGGFGSRVTRENFDKVRAGMTEAELTAILGTPRDALKDAQDRLDAIGGIAGGLFGKKLPDFPKNALNMKALEWRNGNDVIFATMRDGKAVSIAAQLTVGGKVETLLK